MFSYDWHKFVCTSSLCTYTLISRRLSTGKVLIRIWGNHLMTLGFDFNLHTEEIMPLRQRQPHTCNNILYKQIGYGIITYIKCTEIFKKYPSVSTQFALLCGNLRIPYNRHSFCYKPIFEPFPELLKCCCATACSMFIIHNIALVPADTNNGLLCRTFLALNLFRVW